MTYLDLDRLIDSDAGWRSVMNAAMDIESRAARDIEPRTECVELRVLLEEHVLSELLSRLRFRLKEAESRGEN